MGPIKTELQTAKIAKGPECNFCIKFSIGTQTWVSDSFKVKIKKKSENSQKISLNKNKKFSNTIKLNINM